MARHLSVADRSKAFHPVVLDPERDKSVIQAIKDFSEGKANEDQQRAAWAFLIERASGFYDLSYRPDDMGGARDTAFHEGRRFVGAQMMKIATTPTKILLGE